MLGELCDLGQLTVPCNAFTFSWEAVTPPCDSREANSDLSTGSLVLLVTVTGPEMSMWTQARSPCGLQGKALGTAAAPGGDHEERKGLTERASEREKGEGEDTDPRDGSEPLIMYLKTCPCLDFSVRCVNTFPSPSN